MKPICYSSYRRDPDTSGVWQEPSAFALIEFLIASMIFLTASASVFNVMNEIQRVAAYQAEVQSVLDNTRIALETTVNLIRQAGNDPFQIGFEGVIITGTSQVQLQSDLVGSTAPASPDKGDPDGDISDSGENVILRHNPAARALTAAQGGGGAQAVAAGISDFSLDFYDANGLPTHQGSEARRVTVTVSGASLLPDPQTGRHFAIRLSDTIRILTR